MRRLSAAGRGSWFGAFSNGELAGTLVCHAGRFGIGELGATTLVIVADADSAAARLYQSAGFAPRESQVALERPPPGPAA